MFIGARSIVRRRAVLIEKPPGFSIGEQWDHALGTDPQTNRATNFGPNF